MNRNGYTIVETSAEAEGEWTERVIAAGAKTLLLEGDQSTWLLGTNVEGKVKALLQFLEGARAFRNHCDALRDRGFEDLRFS